LSVPFFDIHYRLDPEDRAEILERWGNVLDHGGFIGGPEIGELEEKLSSAFNLGEVVACSNGSDALVLALKAVGVRPGDEVVVPAFTFFATAGAIARIGAIPVFADVEMSSYLMSTESAVSKVTDKTSAIMTVHLFGRQAPVAPLAESVLAATGRAIPILEDAAQSIGSVGVEGDCGALGIASGFSCFPTKNLGAAGDAGFSATRDPDIAERMRSLRNHGGENYIHKEVGFNFRMDPLQAAFLLHQLPKLAVFQALRIEAASHYRKLVLEAGLMDWVICPEDAEGHIFHQYVIQSENRDALKLHLESLGVGSAIYYPVPLHLQPCFSELGGRAGDLPGCEALAERVLALPIHPGVTPEQREEVVSGIASFYS
tara:strand:+ start:451 stop:1566 length:1116 start_codon:yes stop_codon:yes gene_type:complete